MSSIVATILTIAGFGTFFGLIAMFTDKRESKLERYINSRNPINNVDVDTFTREFELKHSRLP